MNSFLVRFFREIIIITLILVILGLVIYVHFQKKKFNNKINEQTATILQLKNNITRHNSKQTDSEEIDKFSKDSNIDIDVIKNDLDKFDADIKSISKVSISSSGTVKENIKSTSVIPNKDYAGIEKPTVLCDDGKVVECPDGDKYKYLLNTQVLALNEPFDNKSIPLGSVSFSAWKENPWSLDMLPRQYNVVTVVGVNEDNKHYVYSKFYIKINDSNYELTINDAQTLEERPSPKFRFNPRLLLGFDTGATINSPMSFEFIPNLQLSLASYDSIKVLPTWSFIGIGAGYSTNNKTISFIASPVSYNVGKSIPLMQNLYLGPSISLDVSGNVGILFGAKLGL